MKRVATIMSVIAGIVLIIGLVEWLTNFHWAQGDQNAFFGNPRILLNDGATALIAGGLLVIGSAIMWFLALRRGHGDQHQS